MKKEIASCISTAVVLLISVFPSHKDTVVEAREREVAATKESNTTDQRLGAIEAAYSEWLMNTGLSKPSNGWSLEVEQLFEVKCPKEQDIPDKGSMGPINWKRYRFDEEEFLSFNFRGWPIDCQNPSSPVPRFILSIRFETPEKNRIDAKEGWKILNSQFQASEGVSLNERLLFKLSHLLGVKVDDTRIHFKGHFIGWYLKAIKGKVRWVRGIRPLSVTKSTLITKNLIPKVGESLADSAQTRVSAVSVNGQIIEEFLDNYFGLKNADIKKIDIDDHYAELSLGKLRGEVLEGERYWEYLQVCVFIVDEGENVYMRLLLDGRFSAGLKPPPLTAYSDMEPVYSMSLGNYAGQLLTSLRQFILDRESLK